MSIDNEFQRDIVAKAKALKNDLDWVFGYLPPANMDDSKPLSVTFLELGDWLTRNDLQSPRLLWDREHSRALLQVLDFEGNHKTYTFDTIIQLIQEGS